MSETRDVTALLVRMGDGDRAAHDAFFPVVYEDLKRIARAQLRRNAGGGETMNTQGLVHESYLRLIDPNRASWHDRSHFFAVASKAMRHILIDYARRKGAEKRGGGARPVTLHDHAVGKATRLDLALAVDEALRRLAERDEEIAAVVECRFFGGLTVAETAEALELSVRTVERHWTRAKAYLSRELEG